MGWITDSELTKIYWMKIWGMTSPTIAKIMGYHPQVINLFCRNMGLKFGRGFYQNRNKIVTANLRGNRKTNWNEIVDKLGYLSERNMWNDLYSKWGCWRIAKYFWDAKRYMISGMTINNRLHKLDYKMRPKGGNNRTEKGVKSLLIRDKNKLENLTAKEIAKLYGITDKWVRVIGSKEGLKYKSIKGPYKKRKKHGET